MLASTHPEQLALHAVVSHYWNTIYVDMAVSRSIVIEMQPCVLRGGRASYENELRPRVCDHFRTIERTTHRIRSFGRSRHIKISVSNSVRASLSGA
jgi:hypothetical protein